MGKGDGGVNLLRKKSLKICVITAVFVTVAMPLIISGIMIAAGGTE
jgi:hypothetical protein